MYPLLPIPTELSFEPINLCNAKCYCCPYSWLGESKEYRGKKMSTEQIRSLMTDFANILTKYKVRPWTAHVQPWRFSDPLVCPDLELILELANENKMQVTITTNGISFTDKNCKIISKYRHLVKKMNISIIGINAEDIKKYMGVNWEVTKKRFINAKNKYPEVSQLMRIGIKDALDRPISDAKATELKKEFLNYTLGKVKIKQGWLHNRMSQGDGVWTESKNFAINEDQFVQGCVMDMGKILRRIEILVDGTAVLCCDDATKLTNYGNVFTDGIEKVWKNLQDEHKLIYNKMYSKQKKKLICNTCSRARFKITPDQTSKILASQNTTLALFN
tara:strand:+ start:6253 stop:7248 length:996 start_codon:yes stop_codon:yes gene_type:complete